MDGDLWLVVGLGNPGTGYAANRHNVGQMVLTELADRGSANFRRHKTNAAVAETRVSATGPRLVLAKPNSFMNLSGGPVAALVKFFKVPLERLIVVHDELDIPFDTVRLKSGGGHGGHNGIRDIAAALGSPDFVRVRVGIGRPPGRQPAADFVLRDFGAEERKVLPNLLADAADAVELVARVGLTEAQQTVHAPRPAR
ncbi:PTH1 family peptidyl-tRNA hydrolase [Diaminobutyricimonas aerilata]|uniref:Peptidyl-tRNA hydrolase n=1 Tax=Diaminobutyricimonas aerilata TaxID=1162967 RepID=A0A2M9CHU3_9MICO|nr:aminoacyl-tRNA hydrolase [Diaminobutyricimonas aerilata]PJJ71442.1 PTH1 family peptidyl-tRNA hydrolase [Diaminobutyricimonas aerilata]